MNSIEPIITLLHSTTVYATMRLLLILSFILAFASDILAYDGWSGVNPVQSIRNYQNNDVLIQMPGSANPSGCDNTSYIYLPQDGSEARKKQYATLLSAYLTNSTVNLALTGCSSSGTSGYPVIEQVWLRK